MPMAPVTFPPVETFHTGVGESGLSAKAETFEGPLAAKRKAAPARSGTEVGPASGTGQPAGSVPVVRLNAWSSPVEEMMKAHPGTTAGSLRSAGRETGGTSTVGSERSTERLATETSTSRSE